MISWNVKWSILSILFASLTLYFFLSADGIKVNYEDHVLSNLFDINIFHRNKKKGGGIILLVKNIYLKAYI